MNYSTSEENYIKAIYHLQQEHHLVTTNALSNELDTRPASVTDMLKKLKQKKLLHYEKYKGFSLTALGNQVALGIIRRHRLWEYFLVDKLLFTWDEVHEVAEELEHVTSRKLVDRLDEFLGFPTVDPHGDPIPDKNGNIVKTRQVALPDLPLNRSAPVCSVGDQSTDMLELLRHYKIKLGTVIQIKKVFRFDNSMEVAVANQDTIIISEQVAKNLFVKYEG
ncbi:MAG TPA: metal-dependent transcriptional regulator [Parasegetibacter sp.]